MYLQITTGLGTSADKYYTTFDTVIWFESRGPEESLSIFPSRRRATVNGSVGSTRDARRGRNYLDSDRGWEKTQEDVCKNGKSDRIVAPF